jgi:4-diphosphocytidyl-2-C-methyl-D-erythritol kinase
MFEKSYTRVTLSLDIIRKIKDGEFAGYHELGIIKHKIDLHDTITIEESAKMVLECDNPLVPCDSRNICWKAVDLLKAHFNIDKNVRIYLEKHIPVMGGLAGGSANAATTLSILNTLWCLELTPVQMMTFGRKLGMDVPFYFSGSTAFDSETTGRLEPISHSCKFTFVLAVPDFGVSTRDAYLGVDYSSIGKTISKTDEIINALSRNLPDEIFPLMHNDFELSVFKKYPRLLELKEKLINSGCKTAIMSGSGSTMLGVAENYEAATRISSILDCKTIIASSLK